jgi:hypothetical protein
VQGAPELSPPQIHRAVCLKSNTYTLPAAVPMQIRPLAAKTVGDRISGDVPPRTDPSTALALGGAFAGAHTARVMVPSCAHRKTSRSICTSAAVEDWAVLVSMDDALDMAEKCDEGEGDTPRDREWKVVLLLLAGDATRAWLWNGGLFDRRRETVGWRCGVGDLERSRENLARGKPVMDDVMRNEPSMDEDGMESEVPSLRWAGHEHYHTEAQ